MGGFLFFVFGDILDTRRVNGSEDLMKSDRKDQGGEGERENLCMDDEFQEVTKRVGE